MAAIPDQLIEIGPSHFQMELETESRGGFERLDLAGLAVGAQGRAGRQRVGFSVPVKGHCLLGHGGHPAVRAGHHPDREPADLPVWIFDDAGTKAFREDLRAEANPNDRQFASQTLAHERLLCAKPGVDMLIVYAHRSAHQNQPVESIHPWDMIARVEPGDSQREPAGSGPAGDGSRPLEGDVLDTSQPDTPGVPREWRRRRGRIHFTIT